MSTCAPSRLPSEGGRVVLETTGASSVPIALPSWAREMQVFNQSNQQLLLQWRLGTVASSPLSFATIPAQGASDFVLIPGNATYLYATPANPVLAGSEVWFAFRR